jgi:cyclohexa-1,5-dienecarbonyl-CoA hydratase
VAKPVEVVSLDDGAFWRVTVGAGKGNVYDRATMRALTLVFNDAQESSALKAICLEGAGPNFSYGASVSEHLPEQVEDMLRHFHDLIRTVVDSSVVVAAAVRGQCLGGALELITVSHRVFASPDAKFGQPEIVLGVFAPVASAVLADRVGRAHAEDLCLTGRVIGASEAAVMGLVHEVTDADPADAALGWLRSHLGSKSAASLRLAVKAVRRDLSARLRDTLPALERLYLDELMATTDAVEGLQAFLEKRPPVWTNA